MRGLQTETASELIPEDLRQRVREAANNQGGYCCSLQKYILGILEIDPIIPKAAGGSDDEDNLSRSQTLFTALSLALTLNPSPKLGEGL